MDRLSEWWIYSIIKPISRHCTYCLILLEDHLVDIQHLHLWGKGHFGWDILSKRNQERVRHRATALWHLWRVPASMFQHQQDFLRTSVYLPWTKTWQIITPEVTMLRENVSSQKFCSLQTEAFLNLQVGVREINSGLCCAPSLFHASSVLRRAGEISCHTFPRQRDMSELSFSVLHHLKVTSVTVRSHWQATKRDMQPFAAAVAGVITANGSSVNLKSLRKFPLILLALLRQLCFILHVCSIPEKGQSLYENKSLISSTLEAKSSLPKRALIRHHSEII